VNTHYLKRIAEALERIACKLEGKEAPLTEQQRFTRNRLREQERLSTQRAVLKGQGYTEEQIARYLSGEFDALDEPGDW
jgi:glutamine synthetase type III